MRYLEKLINFAFWAMKKIGSIRGSLRPHLARRCRLPAAQSFCVSPLFFQRSQKCGLHIQIVTQIIFYVSVITGYGPVRVFNAL